MAQAQAAWLVLGLLACLRAVAQPTQCDGVDADRVTCMIGPADLRSPDDCDPRLKLTEAYDQLKLRAGVDYRGLIQQARPPRSSRNLQLKVIFRPANRDKHQLVLALNPHPRRDVSVCAFHEIEVYVGRDVSATMLDVRGKSLADAEKALAEGGFAKPRVHPGTAHPLDPDVTVASQWPEAGALIGRGGAVSGFSMPAQQPLLVVEAHAAGTPPTCPVCPHPPPQVDLDEESEGNTGLLASGAAGLGVGYLLSRLMGGGGSTAPATPEPAVTMRLPLTRVRPDRELAPPDSEEARG